MAEEPSTPYQIWSHHNNLKRTKPGTNPHQSFPLYQWPRVGRISSPVGPISLIPLPMLDTRPSPPPQLCQGLSVLDKCHWILVEELLCQAVIGRIPVLKYLLSSVPSHLWPCLVVLGTKCHCFPRTHVVKTPPDGPSRELHTPWKGGLKPRRPMWYNGTEQLLLEGFVPSHVSHSS
jgi:hypothetical protein